MKLTPLDIRKQEFGKQMRGYDAEEVRSFLEMVADEYEALLAEREELAKQAEFHEAKLKEYQEMESSLQDAMMNAQKAGKAAESESTKRAELILQQAELDAERMLQDARKRHQRLLDDIHRLEGQRRAYLLKMKQILRGQIELIEILEQESPEEPGSIEHDPREEF
ncbi:MAG TPA: DivIVA domain-containing protein [Bacteroidetes bacterium]|nr:DivIVA domain-containing protein [Bacteroidota bacterium]